ncbi:glycosyltransferase family 9 protein [Candidatus Roizmanbacteria bacterium]|nr:MAG: glycosyltransferase family 9 protein [Candidatus Roizmanbacteria bacterium]
MTQRIAVLRAISLGDFIVALPALYALRAHFPDAHIDLLARPWMHELAEKRPFPFNSVISVPVFPGVYDDPAKIEDIVKQEAFFSEMQKKRYDLAIQLHGGGRNSNPFVKRLGANYTIGMKTDDAPDLDKTIPYRLYQHEVHRYLEVVSLAGASPVAIDPKIPTIEEDYREATEFIRGINSPYVVLHTGASDSRRIWPADSYAQLGDRLYEEGYEIVLTGTISEENIITEVQKAMKHQAVNLCGKLSLRALIGVLKQTRAVISNDTGPMHLARAIGIPTIGIYWFPNMIHWSPVTRSTNRTAISWIQECEVCRQPLFDRDSQIPLNEIESCGHMKSYVSSVTVDEVFRKTIELIS